tara:strand:- start:105 stop:410 length:306 start_codon:yes stop_codon:yes gene_type:complete
MTTKRHDIKIWLSLEERYQLDVEAERLGMSRSALIRERALAYNSGAVHLDFDGYSRALSKAAQTVSGIPRTQLEAIVASVINTICHAETTDPVPAAVAHSH